MTSRTQAVAAGAPLAVMNIGIQHEGAEVERPRGLSFTVLPGEVLLIMGPSGSGKSTLSLALNGLIPHAIPAALSGRVLVGDKDTARHTVAQLSRSVSMVLQDPDSQVVTGSVFDEVCFGPENLRFPVDEVLDRAERALRQVSLWERRHENPDALSGGGRQRLAIACALAMGSPVIVLDEPTANLDPAGIESVYEVLRDLVADRTHAIVLIEHNLDAAIELVDRIVVLDRDGHLAFTGTVDEVIRERGDELENLGVWMPVATLAARRLRAAGVTIDPMPTTPSELAAGLDGTPALPSPARASSQKPVRESAPIVQVRGLNVTGRGHHILRDVNLEVTTGAFLAIVGTNGAGKTTLLQAIAGVRQPPRGSVSVAGIDPATVGAKERARAVGFVFQNPEHQFIKYTVAEELAHGLEIQGLSTGEIAHRVDTMLDRFGLTELRNMHPFLLSGGQKRRLSVGAALITGAPILALDEPTFGQDRAHANELLETLAQLNDNGTTVVIVTHDMQLVAEYASHIAVLHKGSLAAFGRSEQVLSSDTLDLAGLRPPPLSIAIRMLKRHTEWRGITRLRDLPSEPL